MRRNPSLTQRVIWAVSATVALLVGLQSLLAQLAMRAQEDELSDALLEHETRDLVAYALQPGQPATGVLRTAPHLVSYLTRGSDGIATLPPAVRELAPGLYRLHGKGRVLHVTVTDTVDGRLTVVLDATDSEARVSQFGWILFGLWLLCVAVTIWIARAVATLAVGPMVAATRLIAGWSPAPEPGAAAGRDEAAVLMETFNRFRDRMDASVAHEREFAANLDHEIRTPLTAIRTHAELLGVEGRLSPAQAERVRQIVESVDEIVATAEQTKLTLAGGSRPAEPVSLPECVRSACDSLADRAREHGLVIRSAIAPGSVASADRQALLTVVRNIVRNAVEHAAPATLSISGDAAVLRFADDGPGVAADDLAHIFERYYRGRRSDEAAAGRSSRRGLGLAIARRLCDLNGWKLAAQSPCPGTSRGTCFVLRLGPDHAAMPPEPLDRGAELEPAR